MDFPVFSCGVTPMTGKYRMECAEVNGPVSLCGCLVMPGDLIVADGSGVCIVPNELIEADLKPEIVFKAYDLNFCDPEFADICAQEMEALLNEAEGSRKESA